MIDDIEAEASLRVVGGIGRMIPMHCTAVGKALLAFSDLPFSYPIRRFTPPGPLPIRTNWQLTWKRSRRRGTRWDDEEHQEGVRCLAAPVYDYIGSMIATIGISGPTVRVTVERVPELARAVMAAARELSDDLRAVSSVNGQKR